MNRGPGRPKYALYFEPDYVKEIIDDSDDEDATKTVENDAETIHSSSNPNHNLNEGEGDQTEDDAEGIEPTVSASDKTLTSLLSGPAQSTLSTTIKPKRGRPAGSKNKPNGMVAQSVVERPLSKTPKKIDKLNKKKSSQLKLLQQL